MRPACFLCVAERAIGQQWLDNKKCSLAANRQQKGRDSWRSHVLQQKRRKAFWWSGWTAHGGNSNLHKIIFCANKEKWNSINVIWEDKVFISVLCLCVECTADTVCGEGCTCNIDGHLLMIFLFLRLWLSSWDGQRWTQTHTTRWISLRTAKTSLRTWCSTTSNVEMMRFRTSWLVLFKCVFSPSC